MLVFPGLSGMKCAFFLFQERRETILGNELIMIEDSRVGKFYLKVKSYKSLASNVYFKAFVSGTTDKACPGSWENS